MPIYEWANGPLYAAHIDDELIMIGTSRAAIERGLRSPNVIGKRRLEKVMVREMTPALADLINKSGFHGRRIRVLADQRLGTYDEWRKEHSARSSNGTGQRPGLIHTAEGNA